METLQKGMGDLPKNEEKWVSSAHEIAGHIKDHAPNEWPLILQEVKSGLMQRSAHEIEQSKSMTTYWSQVNEDLSKI